MNHTSWRFAGVLLVFLVFQLGFCATSEAGTVTWSVKNTAGTVVCSDSGNGTANLPTACGTDLQFLNSGGTARIEAIDGGANDILQLVNTRIVAQKILSNYILTFYHTFVPGPSSLDYTPIFYRTRMYGNISSLPNTNNITVTSTVEHPVGTVLLNGGPLSHSPGPPGFDLWHSPSTSSTMNQDRKIIVNVKFTLDNTDYLNFPAGRFVKVSAQSYPDDSDDVAPPQTGTDLNALFSEVQRTIASGGKVCLGVSLPNSGCSGMYFVK